MHLITGASGELTQITAELLLEPTPADQVILTTRVPGEIQSFAGRGVQVRYADFTDSDSLEAAFAGAERILLLFTNPVGSHAVRGDASATWLPAAPVGAETGVEAMR
ncbi:NAD(P)H-binding protein [Pseudonocardia lutea]|uniref:NAD(P)H-binding protein n=1 Tax=Pseudonocardia lutea TaxID=2172015 RepID=A0ABW1I6J3_9PSEU